MPNKKVFKDLAPLYWEKDIPVCPISPGKKHPNIKNWQNKFKLIPKPKQPMYNNTLNAYGDWGIGLLCGKPSGILAVDIDTDDKKYDWIESPVQKRGRKGRTCFFKWDGEKSTKLYGEIDILACGKQTVLPPTIHPDTNNEYVWLSDYTLIGKLVDIEKMPTFNMDRLLKMGGGGHHDKTEALQLAPHPTLWEGWIKEFSENNWMYTGAEQGERNEKLLCYVKSVMKDKEGDTFKAALHRAKIDNDINSPKLTEQEVLKIVESAYADRWEHCLMPNDTIIELMDDYEPEPEEMRATDKWGYTEDKRILESPVSDLAYALRVVKRYKDELCCSYEHGVCVWDARKGVWRKSTTNGPTVQHLVFEMIKTVILSSFSEPIVQSQPQFLLKSGDISPKVWSNFKNSMLSTAKFRSIFSSLHSISELYIDKEFDASPSAFNTPDGTINLNNGVAVPHSPSFMCSMISGEISPTETEGLWEQFVSEIMGDDAEMVEYLQRISGYCLFGKNDAQKWFFFHGTGANGKTVFLEVMCGLLGEYACALDAEVFIRSKNTNQNFVWSAIAGLVGKRLAVSSEIPENSLWNERILKELTGQGQMQTKYMGQDAFTFKPECKLIIAGNSRPRSEDSSVGFWRRMQLVPFNVQIPEERRIDGLSDILLSRCGESILSWCVEGYGMFLEHGLEPPKEAQEAKEEYELTSDPIRLFIEKCCVECSPKEGMNNGELLKEFKDWAHNNDEVSSANITSNKFGRKLRSLGFSNNSLGKKYGIRVSKDYEEEKKSYITRTLSV